MFSTQPWLTANFRKTMIGQLPDRVLQDCQCSKQCSDSVNLDPMFAE